jgi:hypothetical protein
MIELKISYEKGKVEYINTLGILATFEGSDPSLKPFVLYVALSIDRVTQLINKDVPLRRSTCT